MTDEHFEKIVRWYQCKKMKWFVDDKEHLLKLKNNLIQFENYFKEQYKKDFFDIFFNFNDVNGDYQRGAFLQFFVNNVSDELKTVVFLLIQEQKYKGWSECYDISLSSFKVKYTIDNDKNIFHLEISFKTSKDNKITEEEKQINYDSNKNEEDNNSSELSFFFKHIFFYNKEGKSFYIGFHQYRSPEDF